MSTWQKSDAPGHFHLRRLSMEQIEGAFEKALKELTGHEYAISIASMNTDPEGAHTGNLLGDVIDVQMRVKAATPEYDSFVSRIADAGQR